MLKQSIAMAIASATAQATVAVLYIIVARTEGPALFGQVVVTVAVANFIAGAINFGTNNLWVREASSGLLAPHELSRRMKSKLLIAALAGLTIAGGIALFEPSLFYYTAGFIAFTVVAFQTLQVPLKVAVRGFHVAMTTLAERAFAGLFFIILLQAGFSASWALLISLSIGSLSAGVACFMMARTKHQISRSKDKWVWPWKGTMSYGLGGLTLSAQALDATIIHAVAGPVATGMYGAVSRWTQPMSVFGNAFATAGLPIVARHGSLKSSYGELKNSWWLLGVAGIGCICVALLSPWIVDLILGNEYKESAVVLSILAIGTIPALLNQPLYVFLQAMGQDRKAAIHVTCSVVLQLALCVLLGFMYAAVGAAIALATAQIYLLVGFSYILARQPSMNRRQNRKSHLIKANLH